jgi:hypothetical protein
MDEKWASLFGLFREFAIQFICWVEDNIQHVEHERSALAKRREKVRR